MSADLNETIARAELVLKSAWGAWVRLGEVTQLSTRGGRNLVVRCAVLAGPGQAPASVVLKQARGVDFNPREAGSRAATGLFRDWAGLQFLGALPGGAVLAPKLYGGDRATGILVMEDLSAAPDLDSVLTCGNSSTAERALLLLAQTLGRMHACTAGKEAHYQRLRDALGPGDPNPRQGPAAHVRDSLPALAELFRELALEVTESFFADGASVAQSIEEPGPFLTYTHGDPCPDNCRLVGDRLCLIDFEFGGYRHALMDGIYARLRFPTCWAVRDIPEPVLTRIDTAYRDELARRCPAALDPRLYQRALVDAGAFWIIENLAHMLKRALEYEQPMGTTTNRKRLVTRLAAFNQLAAQSAHLPGLHQTTVSLLEKLRGLWHGAMPLYDAFRLNAALHPQDVYEIITAVKAGDDARVRQLLAANGALVNAKVSEGDQEPLLYLAVTTRNRALVLLLLEKGADWRVTTRSGWTILAKACETSTPEVIELLLERGADLNTRDEWGSLPIYGALGNPVLLSYLLSRGAQFDLKSALDLQRLDLAESLLGEDPARAAFRFGTGLTLLHDCARIQDTNLQAMALLVRYGADVNARTNWQATPLHVAAFNGSVKATEFLLEHGAVINAVDNHGRTPLALAAGKGHDRCAQLLRGRGATA